MKGTNPNSQICGIQQIQIATSINIPVFGTVHSLDVCVWCSSEYPLILITIPAFDYYSIEHTALRIITGLGSAEVQPQLSRFLQDPKQLLSSDSEELNRALVLTLARAMHVTGRYIPRRFKFTDSPIVLIEH